MVPSDVQLKGLPAFGEGNKNGDQGEGVAKRLPQSPGWGSTVVLPRVESAGWRQGDKLHKFSGRSDRIE